MLCSSVIIELSIVFFILCSFIYCFLEFMMKNTENYIYIETIKTVENITIKTR